jgi:hypothetical protein
MRPRPLVNRGLLAVVAAAGAIIAAVSLTAYTRGVPESAWAEAVSLALVGALPASVVLVTPALGVGLLLLLVPRTRGSGIVLCAYTLVYLLGLAVGGYLAARMT